MLTAFPPKLRAIVYWVYIVLGLAAGSAIVYFAAANIAVPDWFVGVNAVIAFLGAGFGFTAASHVVVKPPPADAAQPEG